MLLPLQPLSLTWTQSAATGADDIHTLKGAEWVGGHVMPTGDALLAGTYLNELLLRLLARDDPHPVLFDAYSAVVRVLASEHGEALEPVLRTLRVAAAARDRPAARPGRANPDPGSPCKRRRATRWWPKAACAPAHASEQRASLTRRAVAGPVRRPCRGRGIRSRHCCAPARPWRWT